MLELYFLVSTVLGLAFGAYTARGEHENHTVAALGALVLLCAAFGFVLVPLVAVRWLCIYIGRAVRWAAVHTCRGRT